MDFHCLSRRELQALCKRNKIPANTTNVAIADSLKSLQIVEGIDELLQIYESETSLSSIESGVRLEVTSPFVPPPGGRTTNRRNSETPTAAHTKMDSLLKDRAQKDALLTLAQLGATSRRRIAVKEDSEVKKVGATRRSARLAEKSARFLKGVTGGNPEFSKKGLISDGCYQEIKVNLKESLDDSDEISGVTDVKSSVEKDDEQVDLAEKQDTATDVEENRNHSTVVPCQKEVVFTVEEVDLVLRKSHQYATENEAESAQKEHNFVEIEGGAGSENLDISGVVEEDFEEKAHEEVVPRQRKAASTLEEMKLMFTVQEEEIDHSEPDQPKTELQDGMHEDSCEKESNSDESAWESESDFSETESIDSNYSLVGLSSDNYMTEEEELISHVAVLKPEEINEANDQVPLGASNYPTDSPLVEAALADDLPPPINIKNGMTPLRASASEASSKMKERTVAVASYNKENIGSISKTRTEIVVRDIEEGDLKQEDKMGQLSKKFKGVYVSSKLGKNERGDEIHARTTLQVLPDNQKMVEPRMEKLSEL